MFLTKAISNTPFDDISKTNEFCVEFALGFEVSNKGCCGSGKLEVSILCNRFEPETCTDDSRYLFWDSYHPTEGAYKIIVDELITKYLPRLV